MSPLIGYAIPLATSLFVGLVLFLRLGSSINIWKKRKVFNAAGWYFVLALCAMFYCRNDMLKEKWMPQWILSGALKGIYFAFFLPLVISGMLAVRFHIEKLKQQTDEVGTS